MMEYQQTNTRALDKALTMLFGEQALPLVHALYKGLDEMEFAGYQAGQIDGSEEDFEVGFNAGYDACADYCADVDARDERSAERRVFPLDMAATIGDDEGAQVFRAIESLGDECSKGLPTMQEQGTYPANAAQPYVPNGTPTRNYRPNGVEVRDASPYIGNDVKRG